MRSISHFCAVCLEFTETHRYMSTSVPSGSICCQPASLVLMSSESEGVLGSLISVKLILRTLSPFTGSGSSSVWRILLPFQSILHFLTLLSQRAQSVSSRYSDLYTFFNFGRAGRQAGPVQQPDAQQLKLRQCPCAKAQAAARPRKQLLKAGGVPRLGSALVVGSRAVCTGRRLQKPWPARPSALTGAMRGGRLFKRQRRRKEDLRQMRSGAT